MVDVPFLLGLVSAFCWVPPCTKESAIIIIARPRPVLILILGLGLWGLMASCSSVCWFWSFLLEFMMGAEAEIGCLSEFLWVNLCCVLTQLVCCGTFLVGSSCSRLCSLGREFLGHGIL